MVASNNLHASATFVQGNNIRYHSPGELMGPRAGLDKMEKRKIPVLAGYRNPIFNP
jgi:hypothetical protein